MTTKMASFISVFIIMSALITCNHAKDSSPLKKLRFSDLSGPYFGLTPPGDKPEMLLPGLLSTYDIEGCTTFLDKGRVCVFSRSVDGTLYTFEKDGKWVTPQPVPWVEGIRKTDFTTGSDDLSIYYHSRVSTSHGDSGNDSNAWGIKWNGGDWGQPFLLPEPVNTTDGNEYYPSVALDGTVILCGGHKTELRCGEIYISKSENGLYQPKTLMNFPISTDYHEVDPVISPDGKYLIFGSGRPGGYEFFDLYVCFRNSDNTWSAPFNAGPAFNPFGHSTRINISSDGSFLIFQSSQGKTTAKGEKNLSEWAELYGDADLFWMTTDFLQNIKGIYLNKKSAAVKLEKNFREQGLKTAVASFKVDYSTRQDETYFELSELMMFCGRLMMRGKLADADELYHVILEVWPEKLRVQLGYMDTLILNQQTDRGLAMLEEMWEKRPDLIKAGSLESIYYQLFRKNRNEDGIKLLKFQSDHLPDSHTAHFELAKAYHRHGKTSEARRYIEKAIKLKPGFKFAQDLLKEL